MNYATGAAINLAELFINITKKKLKSKGKKVTLAVKVFKECLKVILNDCIDNNVTFKLPTGKIESYIYVKRYNGEQFAKLRKLGKGSKVAGAVLGVMTGILLSGLVYIPVRAGLTYLKEITTQEYFESAYKYTAFGQLEEIVIDFVKGE